MTLICPEYRSVILVVICPSAFRFSRIDPKIYTNPQTTTLRGNCITLIVFAIRVERWRIKELISYSHHKKLGKENKITPKKPREEMNKGEGWHRWQGEVTGPVGAGLQAVFQILPDPGGTEKPLNRAMWPEGISSKTVLAAGGECTGGGDAQGYARSLRGPGKSWPRGWQSGGPSGPLLGCAAILVTAPRESDSVGLRWDRSLLYFTVYIEWLPTISNSFVLCSHVPHNDVSVNGGPHACLMAVPWD